MKKFIFATLFILFSILFISSVSVKAMEEDLDGADLRWVCLESKRTSGHEAQVQTKQTAKALPNATTYIVECLQTPENGRKCTTGDSALDLKVFGVDNVTFLQDKYKYKLIHIKPPDNPVKSTADGSVGPILWSDETPRGMGRTWLAMNYYSASNINCGTQGGQQQCTFKFTQAAGNCVPLAWDPYGEIFDAKSLEPLPGVVTELLVQNKDKTFRRANTTDGTDINPNPRPPTVQDGRYSYNVYPNTYAIAITIPENSVLKKLGLDYVYGNKAAIKPNIDPSWRKAYGYQDGKDKAKGKELLFKDGVIVEKETIEHRDIPLMPVGKPYYADRVTVMAEPIDGDSIPGTGLQIMTGRFSHPFTKVCVSTHAYNVAYDTNQEAYNKNLNSYDAEVADKNYICPVADANGMFTYNGVQYPLLGSTQADLEGNYTIAIDKKKLPLGEFIGRVRGQKVPMNQVTLTPTPVVKQGKPASAVPGFLERLLSFGQVYAAEFKEESIIEPILEFIDGYAYDSQGNIVPNAKVGVYVSFSNKPYYETTADEKGHFKISSEFLPTMTYRLIYTTPTGTQITTETSKFVTQNKDYLEKNKINVYSTFIDKEGNKTTITGFPLANQGLGVDEQPTPANQNPSTSNSNVPSSNSSMMMIVVILILLIVAVAATIGFYLMKKRKENNTMEPPLTS